MLELHPEDNKTSLWSVLYRNDTRSAEAELIVYWFVCPIIYLYFISVYVLNDYDSSLGVCLHGIVK